MFLVGSVRETTERHRSKGKEVFGKASGRGIELAETRPRSGACHDLQGRRSSRPKQGGFAGGPASASSAVLHRVRGCSEGAQAGPRLQPALPQYSRP